MTATPHPWGPAYGVKVPDPVAGIRSELALERNALRAERESLAIVRAALTAAEAEVERLRPVVDAARGLPLPCKSTALSKALRELAKS